MYAVLFQPSTLAKANKGLGSEECEPSQDSSSRSRGKDAKLRLFTTSSTSSASASRSQLVHCRTCRCRRRRSKWKFVQSKKKSLFKPLLCCCYRPSHDNTIRTNQNTTCMIIMEGSEKDKKNSSNSNSTTNLRREKSDLSGSRTGGKWLGAKPSASGNPFRYSVFNPIVMIECLLPS